MFHHWASIVALAGTTLASTIFFFRRGLRYLQFFQQEDYESGRFFSWFTTRKAFDRKASPVALGGAVTTYFVWPISPWLGFCLSMVAALWLVAMAKHEDDPRTTGKVTLKMTERAKRIFYLALTLSTVCDIGIALALFLSLRAHAVPIFWVWQVVLFQLAPVFLIAANQLLDPHEKQLQEGFANEARAILKSVNPLVIGITGSYGKTSMKVILADILNMVAPTFTTPRSINSYMGVTREIRDRLKPQHRYAVIEMGAYYTGSIRRMCSLTPPKAAIVTAVGQMHLERFGSQENVFIAKSELPQAVPEDGILVVNGDYEYCRKMAEMNRKKHTFVYGLDESLGPLDAYMYDLQPSDKGTSFTIKWQGKDYRGFTPLLGRPMLSNALGAFTLSCALGLNPELVLAVLRNVKTESNRLEPARSSIAAMKVATNGSPPREGNILRLNDAFNSNPQGFAGALEVLEEISGKRKILVTPGMIELGDRQFEENKRAAQKAAKFCDLVVLVGQTNRAALLEGLKDGGLIAERFKEVPGMKDAFTFLAEEYCMDGDIVLIENDLPDLYEATPIF